MNQLITNSHYFDNCIKSSILCKYKCQPLKEKLPDQPNKIAFFFFAEVMVRLAKPPLNLKYNYENKIMKTDSTYKKQP